MERPPTDASEIEAELQRALVRLKEVEARGELPHELRGLMSLAPPEGASVHVSLRHRDSGRPLGSLARPAEGWASAGVGAWIVYEGAAGPSGSVAPGTAGAARGRGDPLREFVSALDHVERDPHLRFVSLKWFRDTYLPKRGYAWATDPDIPRRIVHESSEQGLIRTEKVPNPKTPEFPVTAIRLNREHPRVREILGSGGEPPPATEGGAEG